MKLSKVCYRTLTTCIWIILGISCWMVLIGFPVLGAVFFVADLFLNWGRDHAFELEVRDIRV